MQCVIYDIARSMGIDFSITDHTVYDVVMMIFSKRPKAFMRGVVISAYGMYQDYTGIAMELSYLLA